jgi:ribosomal subunit interface protein
VDVIVRSRNVEVPSGLRTVVERKVNRLARFTRDASRAEVDFAEERNPRISGRHSCAITLHVRGGPITAHAAAPAPEAAFDLVLEKVRHQVGRRRDRRIRGRFRGRLGRRRR